MPSLKPMRLRGVDCARARRRRAPEAELRPAHDHGAAPDPRQVAHGVERDLGVVRRTPARRGRRRSAPGRASSPGNAGSSLQRRGPRRQPEADRCVEQRRAEAERHGQPRRARGPAPRRCRRAARGRRVSVADRRPRSCARPRPSTPQQLDGSRRGRRSRRRSGEVQAVLRAAWRSRPGARRRTGRRVARRAAPRPRRVDADARRRPRPAAATSAPRLRAPRERRSLRRSSDSRR